MRIDTEAAISQVDTLLQDVSGEFAVDVEHAGGAMAQWEESLPSAMAVAIAIPTRVFPAAVSADNKVASQP